MNDKEQWFEDNYEPFWLLDNDPRSSQIDILKDIDEALNSGYKNIIVNAGVGIGKSAIANTIQNIHNSSYICTKTTNLQNQYIKDFKNLVEFKGRPHYKCNYYERTCAECYMKYLTEFGTVEKKKPELNTHGRKFEFYPNVPEEKYYEIIQELPMYPCLDCKYLEALNNAQKNPYVVVNYHSLYYNSIIQKRLFPREMIVFDECHNLENVAKEIVTFTISPNQLYNAYDINVFDTNSESQLKSMDYWITKLGAIEDILNEQRNEYQSRLDNIDIYFNNLIDSINLRKVINEIDIKLSELNYNISLLEDGMYVELPNMSQRRLFVEGNKITFKPVFGEKYTKNFLSMGETRLFLTGTLPKPKVYCEWIGLNYDDVKLINKKSPYPVTNRPIVFYPIDNFNGTKDEYGNYDWMKYDNIDRIKKILLDHYDENIVIHTTSNDQSNWLYNNLHNEFDCVIAVGNNRDEIIEQFKRNKIPNILISPSIKEGVDFKGDLCTVQIILKLPRPPFAGVNRERTKIYHDSEYMNYFTAINLMQAYGRGVRTEKDNCITYIVDKEFKKWYNRFGRHYLDEYFKEGYKEGLKFNNK